MAPAPKAVQLVRPTATYGFEACSEALQYIEELGSEARIKVLSIAGVARQGKSTLLELLAGQKGSFQAADGTQACTQGIHMLITPVPRERNTYLVLLDSEGIESRGQSDQYMAQLFSMCILFSSTFVYNHMGMLDASLIEELSVAATVLQDITADSSATGDMEALNVRLLMLLRDFDREQLQGQKPNQHLEDWLKEEKLAGPDPTLENQNSVRSAIKRLFRTRDCLTMSPPSGSTTNIAGRKLDQDVEFMEDFHAVAQFVHKTTKPIQLNDQPMNGPQLAAFITQTVEDVSKGTPLIPSALQRLTMLRNSQVSAACIEQYKKRMKAKGVTDSMKRLQDTHSTALVAAKAQLTSKLRGDSMVKTAAINSTVSDIEQMHEHTVQTLAPALNEALMHHCLSKYSKVMGNLSWVRTRQQYEEKHQRASQRAKKMLSINHWGSDAEKLQALNWLDDGITQTYTSRAPEVEAQLNQAAQGQRWFNIGGGGAAASGLGLVALAHPVIGGAVLVGSLATLAANNLNFTREIPDWFDEQWNLLGANEAAL